MFTCREACHEAGHIVIANHVGLTVHSVGVRDGKPATYVAEPELRQLPKEAQYLYFAGGAAGEYYRFGEYDPDGAKSDQELISTFGGKTIKD